MRHFSSIALVALLGAAGVSAQDTVPKELVPLQGTWIITSANGQDVSGQGPVAALTFTGSKYTGTIDGDVNERGTIKLDATKKPATIDLNIVEGDDAGKLQLGVVEITGDTLRMKLSTPGVPTRPTNFDVEDGTFVFTAKKKAWSTRTTS